MQNMMLNLKYVEHDAEEVIYGDVPVEEVYLDENLNEVSSEESVDEEADESDGWAEYIEEEFGDSVENSHESDDSNEQNWLFYYFHSNNGFLNYCIINYLNYYKLFFIIKV